jgi:hypothetical protein
MAEENKDNQVTPEVLAKMQGQIDNLNQGIASTRDENKNLKSNYDKLQGDYDTLKTSIESSKEEPIEEIVLNPEDEKRLEAWAKQKGFVSKEDLSVERQKMNLDTIKSYESQAVSEFLEKHKEYDTDENWQKILSEFSLYRQPTSLDGYRKLLNKIHQGLSGGITKGIEEGRSKAKIEEIQKGRLSLGGGHQGSALNNEQDIENLQKRYPNLSREQILERLSEIGSLYPKK